MTRYTALAMDDQKIALLFPIRGGEILFPGDGKPLAIGRRATLLTVDMAIHGDRKVAAFSLRNSNVETPSHDDLFPVGVLAEIMAVQETSQGKAITLLGRSVIDLGTLHPLSDGVSMVNFQPRTIAPISEADSKDAVARLYQTLEAFCKRVNLTPEARRLVELGVRADVHPATVVCERLPATIVNYLGIGEVAHIFSIEERQHILEANSVAERISRLESLLDDLGVTERVESDYFVRVGERIMQGLAYAGAV